MAIFIESNSNFPEGQLGTPSSMYNNQSLLNIPMLFDDYLSGNIETISLLNKLCFLHNYVIPIGRLLQEDYSNTVIREHFT